MILLSTDIIVGGNNLGVTGDATDAVSAANWIDNQVDIRYYDISVNENIVHLTLPNTTTQWATCIADDKLNAIAIEQLLLQIKSDRTKFNL